MRLKEKGERTKEKMPEKYWQFPGDLLVRYWYWKFSGALLVIGPQWLKNRFNDFRPDNDSCSPVKAADIFLHGSILRFVLSNYLN